MHFWVKGAICYSVAMGVLPPVFFFFFTIAPCFKPLAQFAVNKINWRTDKGIKCCSASHWLTAACGNWLAEIPPKWFVQKTSSDRGRCCLSSWCRKKGKSVWSLKKCEEGRGSKRTRAREFYCFRKHASPVFLQYLFTASDLNLLKKKKTWRFFC